MPLMRAKTTRQRAISKGKTGNQTVKKGPKIKEKPGKQPAWATGGRRKVRNAQFWRRLKLSDIPSARASLERLIRLFDRGAISENIYRSHVTAFGRLLAFLQAEQTMDLERRLAIVEERLKELK